MVGILKVTRMRQRLKGRKIERAWSLHSEIGHHYLIMNAIQVYIFQSHCVRCLLKQYAGMDDGFSFRPTLRTCLLKRNRMVGAITTRCTEVESAVLIIESSSSGRFGVC